mmetsp:Transcript_41094/g.118195  ORF Transcript_41094/g.118195 Transcript_41094/m.118195 type:complete len:221 (-) Transcript_41094:14-676(-)
MGDGRSGNCGVEMKRIGIVMEAPLGEAAGAPAMRTSTGKELRFERRQSASSRGDAIGAGAVGAVGVQVTDGCCNDGCCNNGAPSGHTAATRAGSFEAALWQAEGRGLATGAKTVGCTGADIAAARSPAGAIPGTHRGIAAGRATSAPAAGTICTTPAATGPAIFTSTRWLIAWECRRNASNSARLIIDAAPNASGRKLPKWEARRCAQRAGRGRGGGTRV